MAKLNIYFVLSIITVTLGLNTDIEKNYLNDGRVDTKLTQMGEEAQRNALLVKNLVLTTPSCRVKLTDIANAITYACQTALYEINIAIPFIKNAHLHDTLAKIMNTFGDLTNINQQKFHGNSEELKISVYNGLDKTVLLAVALSKVLHESDCKGEIFLSNQLRKAMNEGFFAIVKVNFQTEFFKKNNKELESEIDARLEAFSKCLQDIVKDDPQTRVDIIYMIETFEQIIAAAVSKLKNFVHINSGDEKNNAIVKEVSIGLSSSYNTFHQLSCESHEVAYLKAEFEKLYRSITNLIKKLANVNVGENTPGDLFIRSVLIDSITSSYTFEREISNGHISTNKNAKL